MDSKKRWGAYLYRGSIIFDGETISVFSNRAAAIFGSATNYRCWYLSVGIAAAVLITDGDA
jgi:hypothetical protein